MSGGSSPVDNSSITGAVPEPPVANSLQDGLHKDGNFTYDNTTDSLEAIADTVGAISGSEVLSAGTVASGSSTTVHITDVTGFGDDYFNDKFFLYVVKNDDGVGTAPEGEYRLITDYVSSTGTFTTDAFSSAVATDDKIYVIHETLAMASGFVGDIAIAELQFFSSSFTTVANITGKGELTNLIGVTLAAQAFAFKITIDGVVTTTSTFWNSEAGNLWSICFNWKFTTDMKVEALASSASDARVLVNYRLF